MDWDKWWDWIYKVYEIMIKDGYGMGCFVLELLEKYYIEGIMDEFVVLVRVIFGVIKFEDVVIFFNFCLDCVC